MENDVIAERGFESKDPGGAETVVVARLRRPRPDPHPGGDWQCDLEIEGFGEKTDRVAYGVDALQALLMALEMLGIELACLRRRRHVEMNWLGQADFGIAVRQLWIEPHG